MNITFLHQSAQYTLLSLTCKDSFQVTLNSIGASIRSIGYTDSAEKFKNIALSFASDSDYTGNTLLCGSYSWPLCRKNFQRMAFFTCKKNITLPETKKTGIACIAVFIVFPL